MISFDQFDRLAHPAGFNLNGKPLLIADGKRIDLCDLPGRIVAKGVCIARVKSNDLSQICGGLSTTALYLHRVHTTDLSDLASVKNLRALEIYGNPKVVDFSTLNKLPHLQLLKLFDNCRQLHLGFLSELKNLRSLCISGGFTGPTAVDSLEPLASLPRLKELKLFAIRVKHKLQLRPLANCSRLETLALSNTFETEQYAFLSVHLPKVRCNLFAAYVNTSPSTLNDTDVMVVGRRKPFLNSRKDASKLEKYALRFGKLQDEFRRTNG